jgi:hypothetical protein
VRHAARVSTLAVCCGVRVHREVVCRIEARRPASPLGDAVLQPMADSSAEVSPDRGAEGRIAVEVVTNVEQRLRYAEETKGLDPILVPSRGTCRACVIFLPARKRARSRPVSRVGQTVRSLRGSGSTPGRRFRFRSSRSRVPERDRARQARCRAVSGAPRLRWGRTRRRARSFPRCRQNKPAWRPTARELQCDDHGADRAASPTLRARRAHHRA